MKTPKKFLELALPAALSVAFGSGCDYQDGTFANTSGESGPATVDVEINSVPEEIHDLVSYTQLRCFKLLPEECLLDGPDLEPCPFVSEEPVDVHFVHSLEGEGALLATDSELEEGGHLCEGGIKDLDDYFLREPRSGFVLPPLKEWADPENRVFPTAETAHTYFRLPRPDSDGVVRFDLEFTEVETLDD